MTTTRAIEVKDLSLDLRNFRTVTQSDEVNAINSMISISPDYFWALMDSLLEDGYLPTENIIVLKQDHGILQVREGNRRIAALKIILGQINASDVGVPEQLSQVIANLSSDFLNSISSVPCVVYEASDEAMVDKIVTMIHGKGQKAGREAWESVARARHNKLKNGMPEIALDLLEKYLEFGQNVTGEQKLRWSGKYALTVLDEAIKKIATRFGAISSADLVTKYPRINHRAGLEGIIHAIGIGALKFPDIRSSSDFALKFGIPPVLPTQSAATLVPPPVPSPAPVVSGSPAPAATPSPAGVSGSPILPASSSVPSPSPAPVATPINNEATVKRSLRSLSLFGTHRAKIVTIRTELLKLKLKNNPIAFCFLLRSMFELSAKAYCLDHSTDVNCPKILDRSGKDRVLADVLKDIVKHLTQNGTDMAMQRKLHGPITEITTHDRLLSITSLNQLVHNPSFVISASDIPVMFSNVFPLLEEMNK